MPKSSRNPAGKPPLPPGAGREERIALRLRGEERDALALLARSRGITLSAAARVAIAAGIKEISESQENV